MAVFVGFRVNADQISLSLRNIEKASFKHSNKKLFLFDRLFLTKQQNGF